MKYRFKPKRNAQLTARDSEVDIELVDSCKQFSKKPVLQFETVPELKIIITLSDGLVNINDYDSLSVVHQVITKSKGATRFATNLQTQTTLTGEVMGLRLGTTHEERWPPASSELQLTLMGILNETYGKAQASQDSRRANEQALPGALSFAIRQLPEAEIDQVLDPNSLYALDFLRLRYTIGAPLDAIMTGDAL